MKATATIRDVARAADVSVASASRALNGLDNVTAALKERVLAAAQALDYVPHVGARSLTTARTNTIGVVLPDLFGEFFSEVIRGIDRAAHAAGLQLLLANMHGDRTESANAVRTMRGRVDGLLVMSPSVEPDFLAPHLPRSLPIVVMNGPAEGPGHAALAIDNAIGARTMVAHLVASGRRRIAHIAGPTDNSDAAARLAGFRDSLAELTGDRDPLVLAGDFTEETGHAAGQVIAARTDVDAVFAANDMMAVGCLSALAEAGRAVPGEIAVAGFDDVPIARYVTPALTTMRVGMADLGARAFERLVQLMADRELAPPPDTLAPELVVRASA